MTQANTSRICNRCMRLISDCRCPSRYLDGLLAAGRITMTVIPDGKIITAAGEVVDVVPQTQQGAPS